MSPKTPTSTHRIPSRTEKSDFEWKELSRLNEINYNQLMISDELDQDSKEKSELLEILDKYNYDSDRAMFDDGSWIKLEDTITIYGGYTLEKAK